MKDCVHNESCVDCVPQLEAAQHVNRVITTRFHQHHLQDFVYQIRTLYP